MYSIGVDIGGTNIKLALVDTSQGARIISRDSFPFAGADCPALCKRTAKHVNAMLRESGLEVSDLRRIGVTVPGTLDQSASVLLHAYNLGYHNVRVKAELEKYFPAEKIRLINDAKAAAMAELKEGALKGCKNALLLTIGTGLGTGIILNGEVFNGGSGRGSEAGHLMFLKTGLDCSCGSRGCMERYTSASRLAEIGGELLGTVYADAKTVIDMAKDGNSWAIKALDMYTDDLADAIAGLCNVLDPERVAIGGGVSAAGDILFEPLRRLVAERNFFRAEYDIVPAKFLNDAGVIGAALL